MGPEPSKRLDKVFLSYPRIADRSRADLQKPTYVALFSSGIRLSAGDFSPSTCRPPLVRARDAALEFALKADGQST